MLGAIAYEVGVDELAAVVGVYAPHGEGAPADDLLQGLKHPLLGLVLDGHGFRPAGGHIHRIERMGVVAGGGAAVVGDEVDFEETWLGILPLGEGFYGDLTLE